MALFNFGKKRRGTESSPPKKQETVASKADPAAKAEESFSQGYALYRKGDYAAAIPFFREAAQLNHPSATVYMGLVYDNGEGVGQDYGEAIRWYRIAADLGHPNAHFNIGLLYEKGLGVEKSDAEAVKWYRNAAQLGLSKGQFCLGYAYDHGEGVEKNAAEAAKWYRAAADQGHARAQTNLGLMYEKGRGVERNYTEAAKWYRAAADQGRAIAQTNLGLFYENGKGVEKDYAEAAKWYRAAADQGYARGQTNLGYLYSKGQGVEQSDVEAVRWYRLAADQGFARAQYNLGARYKSGKGVEQSYPEAAKWYRAAADQGYENAQYSLALLYKKGQGVEKNLVEAERWAKAAQEGGHKDAPAILEQIRAERTQMNAETPKETPEDEIKKAFRRGQELYEGGRLQEAAKWFRSAAEQHHLASLERLAALYEAANIQEEIPADDDFELGEECYQYGDFAFAVGWYRCAAARGSSEACASLADMYTDGVGVEKNLDEAERWLFKGEELERLYEEKSDYSLYRKGKELLAQGRVLDGIFYLEAAAEMGFMLARADLADLFAYDYKDQWLKDRVLIFRAALEEKDPVAIYETAVMFYHGQGVQLNRAEAARRFRLVTEKSSVAKSEAEVYLAKMYLHGDGVEKNLSEAERWAKAAQEGGRKDAPAILEQIRAEGTKGQAKAPSAEEVFQRAEEYACKNEFAEALKCYRIAAEQGHKQALERMKERRGFGSLFALAELYKDGKGVERDLAEAEYWAKEAYTEVSAFAPPVVKEKAYRLLEEIRALRAQEPAVDSETAFRKGEELYGKKEYAEAAKWIRIAAEQGHTEARLKLSVMYERGEGVEKSTMQAKMWQRRSSSTSPIGNARKEKDDKAETAVHAQYLYTDGELLYFMDERYRQFVLRKEDMDERKLAYLVEDETYTLYLQDGMAVDVSTWEYEQVCAKAAQAEKERQAEKAKRNAVAKDMPQGYEAIMTRELFAGDIVLFQGEDHIVLNTNSDTVDGTVRVSLRGFETGQDRGSFSRSDTFWPTKQQGKSPDISKEDWIFKEIDFENESIILQDEADDTVHSLDYEQAEVLYAAGVGSQICTCWFYKRKLYWAEP